MAGRDTITMRSATVDDAAALGIVTVSASLGTFIGVIPEEDLDFGWRPDESAANWRSTLKGLAVGEFIAVAAANGEQSAGFVWAGPAEPGEEGQGVVKGLYVRPTSQLIGVGRSLLAYAAERLACDGMTSIVIGCVRENPSCGFYKLLGGIEVDRRSCMVDRYETEEIVFRWSDITTLLNPAGV